MKLPNTQNMKDVTDILHFALTFETGVENIERNEGSAASVQVAVRMLLEQFGYCHKCANAGAMAANPDDLNGRHSASTELCAGVSMAVKMIEENNPLYLVRRGTEPC